MKTFVNALLVSVPFRFVLVIAHGVEVLICLRTKIENWSTARESFGERAPLQ